MQKFTLVFIGLQIYWLSMNAQWSGDPQVADTKVCTATASQNGSFIIPDGSGGAIVFWQDSRSGSGNDNIYYNKLNGAGNAVWSVATTGLSLTSSAGNYIDQVISDGNGGAFISWETEDGTQLVQHINSAGAKAWGATGVSLSTTGFGGYICSDGNGGIIITWSDFRGDLDDERPQAFVQRVNSSGTVQWTAGGIPVENAAGFSSPFGIISDGAGGAIISITDTRNSNYDDENDLFDNLDVYAQRINASGNVVWTAAGLPVCTYARSQGGGYGGQYTYIVPDGSGGAVIAWDDYRNDPNNGYEAPYNDDVFCQRINASGTALWAANGVALSTGSNDQYGVSLMPDGTGGAVATWFDDGATYAIYTQKINGSGVVQWTAGGKVVVSDVTSINSYTASPDATNSSMLVTWETNGGDIKAQNINVSDGALAWGSTGTLVCGRSDYQSEPAITHNGGAGAIISWTDDRNNTTTSDIYANRVQANGTLPLTLITFEAQLINKDVLLQWNTSSEQSTSHFDIERSTDGNNFSVIGNVNAAGNSSSTIKYSFPDNDPAAGNNFYRLKMIDLDGHFSYSKTIVIKLANATSLSLYPNPAKNTLYLHRSGDDENALIQIVDLAGKKVKEQKVVLTRNTSIDIGNLPKSIYKVIIKTAAITEHLQFVTE